MMKMILQIFKENYYVVDVTSRKVFELAQKLIHLFCT